MLYAFYYLSLSLYIYIILQNEMFCISADTNIVNYINSYDSK